MSLSASNSETLSMIEVEDKDDVEDASSSLSSSSSSLELLSPVSLQEFHVDVASTLREVDLCFCCSTLLGYAKALLNLVLMIS